MVIGAPRPGQPNLESRWVGIATWPDAGLVVKPGLAWRWWVTRALAASLAKPWGWRAHRWRCSRPAKTGAVVRPVARLAG